MSKLPVSDLYSTSLCNTANYSNYSQWTPVCSPGLVSTSAIVCKLIVRFVGRNTIHINFSFNLTLYISFQTYVKMLHAQSSGDCFSIKVHLTSVQDFYCKDKTVSQPSYLYNGKPSTWKVVFILKQGLAVSGDQWVIRHMEVSKCLEIIWWCICISQLRPSIRLSLIPWGEVNWRYHFDAVDVSQNDIAIIVHGVFKKSQDNIFGIY